MTQTKWVWAGWFPRRVIIAVPDVPSPTRGKTVDEILSDIENAVDTPRWFCPVINGPCNPDCVCLRRKQLYQWVGYECCHTEVGRFMDGDTITTEEV
jgi:hypothetical protein